MNIIRPSVNPKLIQVEVEWREHGGSEGGRRRGVWCLKSADDQTWRPETGGDTVYMELRNRYAKSEAGSAYMPAS
jgi:hypothetical protein